MIRSKYFVLYLDALVVLLAIVLGGLYGDVSKFFGEGDFVTWFSFLQLLAAGGISYAIFLSVRKKEKKDSLRQAGNFWLLVALAFVFLALDEVVQIHERLDRFIHFIFGLKESGLTDRIDDLIVLCYGAAGVFVLWLYKDELRKFLVLWPILLQVIVLGFLMVVFDVISNRSDILELFLSTKALAETGVEWLSALEDSLKVFAEGVMIIGLLSCKEIEQDASPVIA